MRWPWPPRRESRARSWRRRTCWPASMLPRSATSSRRSAIPVTLLTGSLSAPGAAGALATVRRRAGRRGCRHARALLGAGPLREPRPRRRRRAAPVRGRAARRPGGQDVAGSCPCPAHDRNADSADGRPGGLRGPRRLEPSDRAGGTRADPHRDPPTGRPRRHLGPGAKGGSRRQADLRRRPADRGRQRGGRRERRRGKGGAGTPPRRCWRHSGWASSTAGSRRSIEIARWRGSATASSTSS